MESEHTKLIGGTIEKERSGTYILKMGIKKFKVLVFSIYILFLDLFGNLKILGKLKIPQKQ